MFGKLRSELLDQCANRPDVLGEALLERTDGGGQLDVDALDTRGDELWAVFRIEDPL